ncbi:hypothetical protein C5167_008940 [Papaver somniferum]|uniref:Uncharacterized protein n=1 Tax=Papaver somniferum TaxID=3469 RepID=A0A4Y7JX28_PAPSO|nr:hypothetical protein C5167_008940 [Papaver somniferum]
MQTNHLIFGELIFNHLLIEFKVSICEKWKFVAEEYSLLESLLKMVLHDLDVIAVNNILGQGMNLKKKHEGTFLNSIARSARANTVIDVEEALPSNFVVSIAYAGFGTCAEEALLMLKFPTFMGTQSFKETETILPKVILYELDVIRKTFNTEPILPPYTASPDHVERALKIKYSGL